MLILYDFVTCHILLGPGHNAEPCGLQPPDLRRAQVLDLRIRAVPWRRSSVRDFCNLAWLAPRRIRCTAGFWQTRSAMARRPDAKIFIRYIKMKWWSWYSWYSIRYSIRYSWWSVIWSVLKPSENFWNSVAAWRSDKCDNLVKQWSWYFPLFLEATTIALIDRQLKEPLPPIPQARTCGKNWRLFGFLFSLM